MMDLRDEIAAGLRDTFNVCGDDPGCQCEYATERSERVARHVLMPPVRRALAEAWDAGFDAASDDLGRSQMMSDMGEGLNPYREGEQK